ncbi:MAG: RlmE family RNA methyltransferase [Planctomycetota bacterium]
MARRVLHDQFFKKAKDEGYASRAAYKLMQLDEKFSLLRPGDRVLDLGCAPGSWLQVAGERVGPSGAVLGLDLHRVRLGLPAHVRTIEGDVEAIDAPALVEQAGGLFDVVMSDMGPKTTGHNDHFLSVRLCDAALGLALRCLKPTGHLAMKVLEGSEYRRLLDDVGELFATCKGYKPAASRSVSREMYIVGKGFVGIAPG